MPIAVLFLAAIASAQKPAIEEGQTAYAQRCIACHGPEAEGTDQGPKLAGSRRVRGRSTQQLRALIQEGRPSLGMPAFHLPAAELDALAAFVHSLNSPAAESGSPGAPAAGQQFFFGQGKCSTCHMVRGRGTAIGPDLSNVGRELTRSELREALLKPDARITPGYELVDVRLRDGRTVRGFARGRTNFDIQLQGLDGSFLMLEGRQIAEIKDEKQSPMKPVSASAAELRDLVAYLSTLTGPGRETAEASKAAAPGIDFARIRNPKPGDWLTYNGSLSGNRYSDLNQINKANVRGLGLRWVFPVDHFNLEVTPIVADGVMYITGPNQVIALDAGTGRKIWHYTRPRTPGLIGDASLGTNRGVAILGDKVFMATDNAHLIALNRTTGSLIWDVWMPDEKMEYGSTVAPLALKDTIIAGVSGGDRGIRGFLAAYKAATGERVWRRWTIPKRGEKGSETWKGSEPVAGGGGTWLTGAYEPETDTLYWPTGNPWPDSDDKNRPGDNLYSNCILAMHGSTGEIKWHYQFTPHDVHDWDATEPPVLVDTEYQGRPRKLLLHADRNGFFYVLDRTDGKVLLGKPFVKRLTWATGIGPDGRPQLASEDNLPAYCPGSAANWNSAAFSPATRLYYVLAQEQCRERRRGTWKGAAYQPEPDQKLLRAINIDTGNVVWEIPFFGAVISKTWPGVLATAGNLVFYGDPNGAFAAADERDGKTLWHFAINVYMTASPMTYMVDGKQFVAVAAGPNILSFGIPAH